jgi:predicted RNA-binding Zn-ribbon protein involved in translation (DUF1610 family)
VVSIGIFNKLFGSKQIKPTITVSVTETHTYTPPEYIYKTAKEKANEEITENQQLWIERYERSVCPNCGCVLKQLPVRDRNCLECGDKILVRSHFQRKNKKVLLQVEEKEEFELEKNRYFDERWCIREISLLDISEDTFMKMKKELGSRFSSFDVMKTLIDRAVLSVNQTKYTVDQQLNFERTRLLLYKANFERRGFTEAAYDVLLHLIVRDFYLPLTKTKPYEMVPGFTVKLLMYKKDLALSDETIIDDMKKSEIEHFGKSSNRINMALAEECIKNGLKTEKGV